MAYINLCDVRDEGITEDIATDYKITNTINTWCKFIDKYCKRWFESRTLDFACDGTGSKYLHLNVPIISITSLYINELTTVLDPSEYHIYNSTNGIRDDRLNPKIVLKNYIFETGRLNQRLIGSFGYLEDGETPSAIKYAAKKIVIEKLLNPIVITPDFEDKTDEIALNTVSGSVIEETTDAHSRRFASQKVDTRKQALSIFKDMEIVDILNSYKNNFHVGVIC